jgi:C4-dicarboxylate transporter DctQ subunit
MKRFPNLVNRLEEGLMATFLAIMTILTSLQVLLRYAFNTSLIWSLEATTYCFAWLVLIGMSYCVRTRAHIALDLLVKRFNDRLRRLIGLLAITVCLCYSLLMFYGSSILVQRLYWLGNEARDLPIARWLLSIILPFGFALLTLRFLQLGLGIWRGKMVGLGMVESDPAKFEMELTLPAGDKQESNDFEETEE